MKLINAQRFDFGQLVATRQVSELREDSGEFDQFVIDSIFRYAREDWGDLSEGDKALNDAAVKAEVEGSTMDRIVARYHKEGQPDIMIVTEYDRSYTTVLFPAEY